LPELLFQCGELGVQEIKFRLALLLFQSDEFDNGIETLGASKGSDDEPPYYTADCEPFSFAD
jgi:hypothetical protein